MSKRNFLIALTFVLLATAVTASWQVFGSLKAAATTTSPVAVGIGRASASSASLTGGQASIFAPQSASDREEDGLLPTSGLITERAEHRAALLHDGRVLITGGVSDLGEVGLAEIYDPQTRVFSAAGSLKVARVHHTATTLMDGRVLVTGGSSQGGALESAEIYDPSAGQFTELPQMSVLRSGHTATLLNDGKVLIAGGDRTGSAELFDPEHNTFIPVNGSLAMPRTGHTATLLFGTEGKVLIAGGSREGHALNTAEIYDPATNSFTLLGATMSSARTGHSAVLLRSGSVALIGGDDTGSVEVFNPADETFTLKKSGNKAINGATASLLSNNRVFIVGGENSSGAATLDSATGDYESPVLSSLLSRSQHTASTLLDGSILIAGGREMSGKVTSSAVVRSGPKASANIIKIVFLTAPFTGAGSITAGANSPTIDVQTQNSSGTAETVTNPTVVTFTSSSPTGAFSTTGGDPTTFTPTLQVTFAASTSAAVGASPGNGLTIVYKDTKLGTPAVTVTVASLGISASQGEQVNASAPAKLGFITTPKTLTAGIASDSITIQSQDKFGNPSAVGGDTTVSLTSTSTGTVTFTPASPVTITGGTSNKSFTYTDTAAGNPTITASPVVASLASATQTESVNADVAKKIAIISAAQTITAGSTSAPIIVQVQDTNGNRVSVTAPLTINLTTTSANGSFRDAGNTANVTSVVIPAGSNSASFLYKDTKSGGPTLTGKASGSGFVPDTAAQAITVIAGSASKLAIKDGAQTITAGALAANLTTDITVEVQDAFGNAVAVSSDTTVTFSSTSATGKFIKDSGIDTTELVFTSTIPPLPSITIAATFSSKKFRYRDVTAGTPTLTASAVAAGLSSASQTLTVVKGAPGTLAFTTANQKVLVGTASNPITLAIQDSSGNTASFGAAVTVNLSSTPALGVVFRDSTNTTTISQVIIPSGGSASFLVRVDDASATTVIVTGTPINTSLAAASQTEVVGGTAAKLAIVPPVAPLIAKSASAGVNNITVALQDQFGNAVVPATPLTVFLSSSSTTGRFFDAGVEILPTPTFPRSISMAGSTKTFEYIDVAAGTVTLTASAGGLTSGSQILSIVPAAASRLVITTAPQQLTTGSASAPITVQVQDSVGNPVDVPTGLVVNLVSSSASGIFRDSANSANITTVTIPAGSNSASFRYRDGAAGSPTITVSTTTLSSGTQTELVTGSASKLSFTNAPGSIALGSTPLSITLTIALQDTNNNAFTATSAVSVNLGSSSPGGVFRDSADTTTLTSVTIPAGSSTATVLYRDTQAGNPSVTASSSGLSAATQVETVTTSAAKLAFTTAIQSVEVGLNSADITVQLQDLAGNLVTNTGGAIIVSLTSTSSAGVFISPTSGATITTVSISTGTSSASFRYRDATVATPTIIASVSGKVPATQTINIVAASGGSPASKLAFTAASASTPAGVSSGLITVQIQDATNSPVNASSLTTVALTTTSSTGVFRDAANNIITSLQIAAGNSSASFKYNDSTPGNPTITASSLGLASASLVFTVTAAGPPTATCGDVNGDGAASSTDALLIRQVVVGLRLSTDPAITNWSAGDVNGDGLVNSTDALLIRQTVVGLRASLPCGSSSPSAARVAGGTAQVGLDLSTLPSKIRVGDEFTVPVYVDSGSQPLGAHTLRLLFDPAALSIVGLSGGSAQGFGDIPLANPARFNTGDLLFDGSNAMSLTVPTGKSFVAMIRFKAVGQARSSAVSLAAVNISDTAGRSLAGTGSSSVIRVRKARR